MITNGQHLELKRRALVLLRAASHDGNVTGMAGPWKLFFNRKQGIWAEKYDPLLIVGAGDLNLWLILAERGATYQQILDGFREIANKMRNAAKAAEKRMHKLADFYADLVIDIGTDNRKLDFRETTKKYQLPK
jgi:hypothetical protein